ncbi:MAG: hypothetical protein IPL89_06685 [Acidobacteria bacterium]|nr:hypothetical protein [Acidobacteriota bacterium]
MKKTLSRALALAGLLALAVTASGCYPYEGPSDSYGYGYSPGVSVSVYGGYYSPGWGGCCYGGPIGMPRPMPVHY